MTTKHIFDLFETCTNSIKQNSSVSCACLWWRHCTNKRRSWRRIRLICFFFQTLSYNYFHNWKTPIEFENLFNELKKPIFQLGWLGSARLLLVSDNLLPRLTEMENHTRAMWCEWDRTWPKKWNFNDSCTTTADAQMFNLAVVVFRFCPGSTFVFLFCYL